MEVLPGVLAQAQDPQPATVPTRVKRLPFTAASGSTGVVCAHVCLNPESCFSVERQQLVEALEAALSTPRLIEQTKCVTTRVLATTKGRRSRLTTGAVNVPRSTENPSSGVIVQGSGGVRPAGSSEREAEVIEQGEEELEGEETEDQEGAEAAVLMCSGTNTDASTKDTLPDTTDQSGWDAVTTACAVRDLTKCSSVEKERPVEVPDHHHLPLLQALEVEVSVRTRVPVHGGASSTWLARSSDCLTVDFVYAAGRTGVQWSGATLTVTARRASPSHQVAGTVTTMANPTALGLSSTSVLVRTVSVQPGMVKP